MGNHYAEVVVATDITKNMLFAKKGVIKQQCVKCDKFPKNKKARFCEDCGGAIVKHEVKDFTPEFKAFAKTFCGDAQSLFDHWLEYLSNGNVRFVDVSSDQSMDFDDRDYIGIVVDSTEGNNLTELDESKIQKAKSELQLIINALGIKSSIGVYFYHIRD